MIAVEVRIAKGVDEFARPIATDLGQHHGQQGVRGDVERDAQENIGAALIELAGELAVGDVKLEQAMAGRQGHLVDITGVPGRNDVSAGVRVVFQAMNQLADLIDESTIRTFPAAPLLAINRAEIAGFVGPFVPDAYAIRLQVGNVGVALQEPEQFVDDRFQVQLLGCEGRESLGEIEAHLPAKYRSRAGSGAVGLVLAVFQNVVHQVEILLHGQENQSKKQWHSSVKVRGIFAAGEFS